jgi:hypothetical protein
VGVSAVVQGERLVVSLSGDVGSFGHELALLAVAEGRPALVLDGVPFDEPAGWLAATDYQPGSPPRTHWFDLVRGLDEREQVEASLVAGLGWTRGVDAYVLGFQGMGWLDGVTWALSEADTATLLPKPGRPKPHPLAAKVTGHPRGWLELAVFAMGWVLLLPMGWLLCGAIAAFAVAAAWSVTGPSMLVGVAVSAVTALGLGAVLGVLPLSWPNGHQVPQRIRQLLLAAPTFVLGSFFAWRGV